MSIAVQHRRGSTVEHSAFTGKVGELTVDTTRRAVVVHDGVMPGGYALEHRPFDTLEEMLASSAPTRGEGARWLAEGFIFDEVSPAAEEYHHVIAATGVKLNVSLKNQKPTWRAFGADPTNTQDSTFAAFAANEWAMDNARVMNIGEGTFKISGPIQSLTRQDTSDTRKLYLVGEGDDSNLRLVGDISFLFTARGKVDDYEYGVARLGGGLYQSFSITGNGVDDQNIFNFEVCSQVHVASSVKIHNVRGRVLDAREYWDSEFKPVCTLCGDDTEGAEKAVLRFQPYDYNNIPDSSSNQIDMRGLWIEAPRYIAIDSGNSCGPYKLDGVKIHQNNGLAPMTFPAVRLRGPRGGRFEGVMLIWSGVRPVELDGTNYNGDTILFAKCTGLGIDVTGPCNRVIVMQNQLFDYAEDGNAAVLVRSGEASVEVFGNALKGGIATDPVTYLDPAGGTPHRFPSRRSRFGFGAPVAGWAANAMHVWNATEDTLALFESGDFQAGIEVKDSTTTTNPRFMCKGNKAVVQAGAQDVLSAEEDGDVVVNVSGAAMILTSPDGTQYRVTIANGGALQVDGVTV